MKLTLYYMRTQSDMNEGWLSYVDDWCKSVGYMCREVMLSGGCYKC